MKGIKQLQGTIKITAKRRAFSTLLRVFSKIKCFQELLNYFCKAFKILLDLWLTSSSHQIGLSQKTYS